MVTAKHYFAQLKRNCASDADRVELKEANLAR
jgi:hypothetical protein